MKRHFLILLLILFIGLIFRTYQIVERFEFAHDGDLYSWVVKDILINHHFRLIGQLTSAPGIFIGPFFYYLLVPFFILTKMDPIGALIPVTILGLFTIFSYYFVLNKLFNKETAFIGAFLYAVLITTVNADRWVVNVVITSSWCIWYLYTLIKIVRKDFSVFPILGILIGLIWHIHIALIPSLIAIPAALLVSRKIPSSKQFFSFLLALVITSMPLIFFEARHHFQQTISLFQNFVTVHPGLSGLPKLNQILGMIIQNTNSLFFAPQSFKVTQNLFFVILILASPLLLIRKGVLSLKDLIPQYAWILGMVVFFSISSSPISEYYFANIEVIFLTIVSLIFSLFFKSSKFGKLSIFLLLGLILIKNLYFIVTENYYNKGYLEKKAVVKYISEDVKNKGFPCVGITYITTPGENVGFRYFFYLSNIHLVHPSLGVPVYNIVIPDELSLGEVKQKFGHIGLIPPTFIPSKEVIEKSCQIPDTNLTDPMFGYVE